MSIERWGAFSVIDHQDPRKIAAEVLLYDKLVLPKPEDWDRQRWVDKKWNPELMDKRIEQLKGIAIPARWDLERQKAWKEKFDSLAADAKDINAALQTTRRVLIDHYREYRPRDVGAIEVLSAYQSKHDFEELDPTATEPEKAAQFNFMVAHRILIPEEEEPEESLKRALGFLEDSKFLERRRRFFEWQRENLAQGILPHDAANELSKLIEEYNEAARASGRKTRNEMAILVGSLGATALSTIAGPAVLAATGPVAKAISIGSAATGGILQIARHVLSQRDPDATTRKELRGAMFHQLEEEAGWRYASGLLGYP